jgi:glycosyltransferase
VSRNPKITVITAALAPDRNLEDCIRSVRSQSLRPCQHILVAACGQQALADVLHRHRDWLADVVPSAASGPYHAFNAGLARATGDFVCFLNSDDVYAHDHALERTVGCITGNRADSGYADLVYVLPNDASRTVRYWRSGPYDHGLFLRGWMPPHPTFVAKRSIYEQFGGYDPGFAISGDYELLLRLLHKHRVSTCYLPEVTVKMRLGGRSNRYLGVVARKSVEDLLAWRTNRLPGALPAVLLKNLTKIPQFFRRPHDAA